MNLQEALEIHKPFLNNKYTKWYMSIVSKECDDEYTERHHILPKCLFPQYARSKWNIIKLNARKHFIAHVLLYRMFEKNTAGYVVHTFTGDGTFATNSNFGGSATYSIN